MLKPKNKKLVYALLPILVLGGFNVCFIGAQNAFAQTLGLQEAGFNSQSVQESCAETHAVAGIKASAPTLSEEAKSGDDTGNSTPICCLNHDNNTAKTEKIQEARGDNSSQPLVIKNYAPDYKPAQTDNLNFNTLGPSPPQGELLLSVIKIE